MKTLTELTNDTGVTSWVPADAYADLIMEAVVCHSQLSGVIGAIEYDLQACDGATIQVRYVPARTAQGPKNSCECLSKTSSTLGTYSITVKQYGDYDELCDFSLMKACGPVKDRLLNEMAKGLAKKRDQVIWTELTQNFTPTYSYSMATTCCLGEGNVNDGCGPAYDASCCSLRFDLYNGIIYLQKTMQGAGYNPDTVILHPTVAAWLYYKDNGAIPPYASGTPLLRFGNDGKLVSIAGMKVIETCNASSCTEDSGATMAVVIDSSRAVGEAWGKRPEFHEDFDVQCNHWKEAIWMYWGASELDKGAIGHILNATH